MPDSSKKQIVPCSMVLLFSFGRSYADDLLLTQTTEGHLRYFRLMPEADGYNYASLKRCCPTIGDGRWWCDAHEVSVYFVEENRVWT